MAVKDRATLTTERDAAMVDNMVGGFTLAEDRAARQDFQDSVVWHDQLEGSPGITVSGTGVAQRVIAIVDAYINTLIAAAAIGDGQLPVTITRDTELQTAIATTLLKAQNLADVANAAIARGNLGVDAAGILSLLLTVDGAGSGLDADLLDGMTPAEVAALSTVTGALLAANNLSDLSDAAVSRTNLGVNLALYATLAGGAVFTDPASGPAPIQNQDYANKLYVDTAIAAGIVPLPTPTHTSYVGVSSDTDITEAEALAGTSGTGNALAVPVYVGAQHVFSLRPATQGAVTAVYIYEAGNRNTQNQLSSWMAIPTLDVGGEDHVGIYSIDPLTGASGLIVEIV